MKKMLVFLCLLLFPSAAQARDLFTGTLEIRDGKPLLIRCDAVKNTYVLEDAEGNTTVWLKRLEKLGITRETPYQATAIGDVRDFNAELAFLTTERLENIQPGSCHLLDALEEWAREAEREKAKDSGSKTE